MNKYLYVILLIVMSSNIYAMELAPVAARKGKDPLASVDVELGGGVGGRISQHSSQVLPLALPKSPQGSPPSSSQDLTDRELARCLYGIAPKSDPCKTSTPLSKMKLAKCKLTAREKAAADLTPVIADLREGCPQLFRQVQHLSDRTMRLSVRSSADGDQLPPASSTGSRIARIAAAQKATLVFDLGDDNAIVDMGPEGYAMRDTDGNVTSVNEDQVLTLILLHKMKGRAERERDKGIKTGNWLNASSLGNGVQLLINVALAGVAIYQGISKQEETGTVPSDFCSTSLCPNLTNDTEAIAACVQLCLSALP